MSTPQCEIGIVIVATNAYADLGIRFIKKFMHFYRGIHDIAFYVFSDVDVEDFLPESIPEQFTVYTIRTKHKSWVDATNSKFTNIELLSRCSSDYLFYFDADTNIDKPFTEEWFLGDMVGGQHFGDTTFMKDKKNFERAPFSKAYIPEDTKLPQMYFYDAFFGGRKDNVMAFCDKLIKWQKEDKSIGFEPCVNDESYINKEFHFNPPTKIVPSDKFEFLISDKGGLNNTRDTKLFNASLREEIRRLRDRLFELRLAQAIDMGKLF